MDGFNDFAGFLIIILVMYGLKTFASVSKKSNSREIKEIERQIKLIEKEKQDIYKAWEKSNAAIMKENDKICSEIEKEIARLEKSYLKDVDDSRQANLKELDKLEKEYKKINEKKTYLENQMNIKYGQYRDNDNYHSTKFDLDDLKLQDYEIKLEDLQKEAMDKFGVVLE